MSYCMYYQATAQKEYVWFIGGILRAEENKWFYRTVDGTPNDLEFFIPPAYEDDFLQLIKHLQRQGSIISYEKKENRLIHSK